MFGYEDIIQKKRDGLALGAKDINTFISGVSSGAVSDAQIAAFTMATWFNGMETAETAMLTLAMRDSGKVMRWPDLGGPVLDKHSTGGVGDLVSLVLGPAVAACGAYVPMISGRGLGHTGGTLDKLESIPGFDTRADIGRFRKLVRETGISIVGQSDELAPADRRMYAVRDVTATVSSPPLMISSILSKKLAEGLDGLVLDIKYGAGAFSPTPADAIQLAERMSGVAVDAGVACSALVTDMNAPLADSAGNALEIREAIGFLRGESSNQRLAEVTLGLSAELLRLGGLASNREEGRHRISECLSSGHAAEKFAAMVAGQGGPADLVERFEHYLPEAPVVRPVLSTCEGYVASIDTHAIGSIVVALGGGRQLAEDVIDPAVGVSQLAPTGRFVDSGEPLAMVHARDEAAWTMARQAVLESYRIGETAPVARPVIHGTIEGVVSNENR